MVADRRPVKKTWKTGPTPGTCKGMPRSRPSPAMPSRSRFPVAKNRSCMPGFSVRRASRARRRRRRGCRSVCRRARRAALRARCGSVRASRSRRPTTAATGSRRRSPSRRSRDPARRRSTPARRPRRGGSPSRPHRRSAARRSARRLPHRLEKAGHRRDRTLHRLDDDRRQGLACAAMTSRTVSGSLYGATITVPDAACGIPAESTTRAARRSCPCRRR